MTVTKEESLPIVAIVSLAVLGFGAWLLLRPKTPKYTVPCEVWGCDEDCRCDELFLESVRYSDGHWEYYLPYPENVWIPESHIDTWIAQGQKCSVAV